MAAFVLQISFFFAQNVQSNNVTFGSTSDTFRATLSTHLFASSNLTNIKHRLMKLFYILTINTHFNMINTLAERIHIRGSKSLGLLLALPLRYPISEKHWITWLSIWIFPPCWIFRWPAWMNSQLHQPPSTLIKLRESKHSITSLFSLPIISCTKTWRKYESGTCKYHITWN